MEKNPPKQNINHPYMMQCLLLISLLNAYHGCKCVLLVFFLEEDEGVYEEQRQDIWGK